MKSVIIFLLLFAFGCHASRVYQCHNDSGEKIYQDRPCDGGAIELAQEQGEFTNGKYKGEMARLLAKMTKKSGKNLSDPKIQKAAEVMAMVDAAKSYAFTQIHGVAMKHCSVDVRAAMNKYQSKASDIIGLGKYYYTHGIHADLGEKKISQTGKELTEGLQGMLDNLDREHAAASKEGLKRKCKEAVSALNMLSTLYAN